MTAATKLRQCANEGCGRYIAGGRGRQCDVCLGTQARAGGLCDPGARYFDDFVARVFVLMHPNGATLELVGAMLGVTRERLRQIEEGALDEDVDRTHRTERTSHASVYA